MFLKFVFEMKFVVSQKHNKTTLWKKKIYYPI